MGTAASKTPWKRQQNSVVHLWSHLAIKGNYILCFPPQICMNRLVFHRDKTKHKPSQPLSVSFSYPSPSQDATSQQSTEQRADRPEGQLELKKTVRCSKVATHQNIHRLWMYAQADMFTRRVWSFVEVADCRDSSVTVAAEVSWCKNPERHKVYIHVHKDQQNLHTVVEGCVIRPKSHIYPEDDTYQDITHSL